MTSPLFRTLQIGSLRYWGSTVEIIETQVIENLDVQIQSPDIYLETNDDPLVLVLQNTDISLQFDDAIDLQVNTSSMEIIGDC